MSVTRAVPELSGDQALARSVAPPRVRDQARDVAAVMGFSASVSTALALCLLLLTSLAR